MAAGSHKGSKASREPRAQAGCGGGRAGHHYDECIWAFNILSTSLVEALRNVEERQREKVIVFGKGKGEGPTSPCGALGGSRVSFSGSYGNHRALAFEVGGCCCTIVAQEARDKAKVKVKEREKEFKVTLKDQQQKVDALE
ncbi:hypothetical protein ACLOJK_026867, partial [Asimina triloba]